MLHNHVTPDRSCFLKIFSALCAAANLFIFPETLFPPTSRSHKFQANTWKRHLHEISPLCVFAAMGPKMSTLMCFSRCNDSPCILLCIFFERTGALSGKRLCLRPQLLLLMGSCCAPHFDRRWEDDLQSFTLISLSSSLSYYAEEDCLYRSLHQTHKW